MAISDNILNANKIQKPLKATCGGWQ